MNKEIENLIRKIFAKNIQIEMIKAKLEGQIISEEIILEILEKLTK